MSFILDALRKSENERQRQASPHVSVTAVGSKRRWQPGWLALIATGLGAALLAVVIVWWFMEPGVTPTRSAVGTAAPSTKEEAKQEDLTVRSLAQEARSSTADTPSPAAVAEPVTPGGQQGTQPAEQLLTVIEAMATGLSLPHMNLDIHVFAPQPDGRFVFVNARKYREGETLREGPRLEEITSDGVILTYQGQRLLLPRD